MCVCVVACVMNVLCVLLGVVAGGCECGMSEGTEVERSTLLHWVDAALTGESGGSPALLYNRHVSLILWYQITFKR